MQIYTISLALCLATYASAKPMPAASEYSSQVKQNITAQIVEWQTDIDTVNTFVDTVLFVKDPKEVSRLATIAFAAAQNEGTSNSILSSEVKLDASGEAASKALLSKFSVIGPAINDTIYHPQNVRKNVNEVNLERCAPPRGKGAISEEGAVQKAAASAVGIVVPPPQTPVACFIPAPTS